MKKLLLLAGLGLATIVPPAALAQAVRPAGLPPPVVPLRGTLNSQGPATNDELKRFDLNFPGGTPGELAEAISKATGRHLNLIIPDAQATTRIMPIKVVGVTVPELFTAIQQASDREVAVITGVSKSPGGGQSMTSIQHKKMSVGFSPSSSPVSDDTVWAFQSTGPSDDDAVLSEATQPERICQYFQLAPYLDDHTVEDITTAIETGWKMLGVEPAPKLSFHQETKLLIAVGASDQVALIPAVLQQLPLDNSAAVEKVARAIAEVEALKTAKEPGWEKKVEEIEARMRRLAEKERARQELRELLTRPPSRPPPIPSNARPSMPK